MLSNYIIREIGMMIIGLIFLGPMAIQEAHEPWFSLWLKWAHAHKDNDFECAWDPYNNSNHHPAGWYDEEFEIWLDENGFDPWAKSNYPKINDLNKYLLRHRYIKRQIYWNRYIYQIRKEKL